MASRMRGNEEGQVGVLALVLSLLIAGVLAPFAGFGLIFGPGGGDQNTTAGGLGFLLILLGAPVFFGAYVWAVALAISVLAQERRDRHSQHTTAPSRAP